MHSSPQPKIRYNNFQIIPIDTNLDRFIFLIDNNKNNGDKNYLLVLEQSSRQSFTNQMNRNELASSNWMSITGSTFSQLSQLKMQFKYKHLWEPFLCSSLAWLYTTSRVLACCNPSLQTVSLLRARTTPDIF